MKAFIAILVILLCYSFCFAETIVLKSGKTVEGKIVERTGQYIKLKMKDIEIPLTYFFDDIESIDGEKPILPTEETKAPSVDSVVLDSSKNKEANQEVIVNQKSSGGVKAIRALPFSTAIITYKDSGEVYNGKEVVYIDATNNKVSHDTFVEAKLGCTNKKITKRDICDGKALYKIDLKEKKAPSFAVEKGDAISNIFMEEHFLKYYKEQKSFLGKECKVYSSMPGEEFYFWNGIMLLQKVTNHPMGKAFNITRKAVNIELNVPIPDDKFEIPSGIKLMTPEETMEDLKSKLEYLKGVKKEDWEKMKEDFKKIGVKVK